MDERIEVIQGDITRLQADAIVNAANPAMLGGGGVDGAIHRVAGPRLREECRRLGGCSVGQAKITGAYQLPARYVIHTVGPIWRGGTQGEAMQLASCYRESLRLAAENGIETVAFPAISCGAYGYPLEEAARIAIREVTDFLDHNGTVMKIYLVCYRAEICEAYRRLIE